MSTESWLVVGTVVTLFLLSALLRSAWFRQLRMRWLVFRLALLLRKRNRMIEEVLSGNYTVPLKRKLEKAQEAIQVLRAGFWVNPSSQKVYLDPGEYSGIAGRLRAINDALEAGFSYRKIGTTREEVIGFRSGDAHKTSAHLQLQEFRELKRSLEYNITKLAEDAGFALEEIGTSAEELESLGREYSRRIQVCLVGRFRESVKGESDLFGDPDEFEERLANLLAPEPEGYGFSYTDLETSEEECAELIQIARRRKVASRIDFFKRQAEEGRADSIVREMIVESLEKAGLTLGDFGLTKTDLDKIERSSYLKAARRELDELQNPSERWFLGPGQLSQLPGDPEYLVKRLRELLSNAGATLEDVETSEKEVSRLLREGYLFVASCLLDNLRAVSKTKRQTEYKQAMALMRALGPKHHFMLSSEEEERMRNTLEEQHPYERDISAIRHCLEKAGVRLEELGSSESELQQLALAIQVR